MDKVELFNDVKQILDEEGITPQHIPNCPHANSAAPINEAPCKCYELFWFMQGSASVNAQCIAKIFKVTQEKAIITGFYRVSKTGNNWSAWQETPPVSHVVDSDEKGNS